MSGKIVPMDPSATAENCSDTAPELKHLAEEELPGAEPPEENMTNG